MDERLGTQVLNQQCVIDGRAVFGGYCFSRPTSSASHHDAWAARVHRSKPFIRDFYD